MIMRERETCNCLCTYVCTYIIQDTVVDREGSTADSMQHVAIYRFRLHRMYIQRDMRRHIYKRVIKNRVRAPTHI